MYEKNNYQLSNSVRDFLNENYKLLNKITYNLKVPNQETRRFIVSEILSRNLIDSLL